MLKLEFDPANKALAAAIGRALQSYAGECADQGCPAYYATTAPVEEGYREVAEASAALRSTEPEKDIAGLAARTEAPEDKAPEVDEKGVAKDPNFCGTAAVPFYASGKRAGQWKKRQGVDDAVYDAWYEAALARLEPADDADEEPQEVNTAAAFGGKPAEAPKARTFSNAGEFMAWVSEQQTAGHLSQADIDAAYRQTGVQVQDLFNPALAGKSIAAVYNALGGA